MTQNDRQRLSTLLGAEVLDPSGAVIGHVNDVRLSAGQAVHGVRTELVIEGVIVSDRHAGSLLGYDRRAEQGPWLVRRIVRLLHRNARYVQWSNLSDVNWSRRTVVATKLDGEPQDALA
jgi:sporulation protein YlmC with PRC-barrel domain